MDSPLQFIKKQDKELYDKLCKALLFARVNTLMEDYALHVAQEVTNEKLKENGTKI